MDSPLIPVPVARRRIIGWLRWWRAQQVTRPVRTDSELAARLGVHKSTLSYQLGEGATRAPTLGTLLAIHHVTGIPIDILVGTPPPGAEEPQGSSAGH